MIARIFVHVACQAKSETTLYTLSCLIRGLYTHHDMQVNMVHGLAPLRAIVDHQSKPIRKALTERERERKSGQM